MSRVILSYTKLLIDFVYLHIILVRLKGHFHYVYCDFAFVSALGLPGLGGTVKGPVHGMVPLEQSTENQSAA